MFVRVNPLGWALFEELTSAQMNQLDLNVSRAIDGLNGGIYNLTSPLIINGTVNISGGSGSSSFTNVTVSGILAANGTLSMGAFSIFRFLGATFEVTASGAIDLVGDTVGIRSNNNVSIEGVNVDINGDEDINLTADESLTLIGETARLQSLTGNTSIVSTLGIDLNAGGDVSLNAGGDVVVTPADDILLNPGGTIWMGGNSGARLYFGNGTTLEARSSTRRFHPSSHVVQLTDWVARRDGLYIDEVIEYGAQTGYIAIPLPARVTEIESVTAFFSTTGAAPIGSAPNTGTLLELFRQTNGVDTALGTVVERTNATWAASFSLVVNDVGMMVTNADTLIIRCTAPTGSPVSLASTLLLTSLLITLKTTGIEAW